MYDNRVIHFENISFTYSKEDRVLSGINLSIYEGETIGIVGANGAGKSTLMKLITGLLTPDSGQIEVAGYELSHKNIKEIRNTVGYTFQDPDNQLFMPSVYDDVAFSAKQAGKDEEEVDHIVKWALNEVGGTHLMDKASYNMSGGEKRLITIATVLASHPEILILDEPSVGLDPRSRRNLIRLLDERKETKIIATHDMDMALDLCDRIVVLCKGKIMANDAPMEIFKNRLLLCDNDLELPLRLQGCPICGSSKDKEI